MATPNFVIGISSFSGGGKSTVSAKVAALLGDAVVIATDDYDAVSAHPASYETWLTEGADYNAFQMPQLADDLRSLKSGQAITSPVTGEVISPASFIVFDAPSGRANDATGTYIDLMVFIDTPLDVAMARRILRDFADEHDALRLRNDLTSYLAFGRNAYLAMLHKVKPLCDLMADGMRLPDEIAESIVSEVRCLTIAPRAYKTR